METKMSKSKTSWKDNEKKMYEELKQFRASLSDLKWSQDKYSRFDAYNDLAIVEFKYRSSAHSGYSDTLIEYDKYQALKTYAGSRVALYVVQAGKTIYIFNLNQLHRDGWNYKWEQRDCNTTTHFSNTNKKSKRVGYIDYDKAYLSFNVS